MKKNMNKTILIVIIILSFSFGFINSGKFLKELKDSGSLVSADPVIIPFIYGAMYLPFTIEPQDCWDSISNDLALQVMETLFTYEYSDPNLPIIPLLASDFGIWDVSYTQYTVPLRTGITFHDSSTFNADDVTFTFNRMIWLYNFSGLNMGYIPDVRELYMFPNGTPIINSIIKNNDYSITFVLNDKCAFFVDLLCYIASSILTPTAYDYTLIDIADDFMVGTGPFVYEHYETGVKVTMHAFDDYWRGRANIDKLVYVGISDANARNAALLSGDVHFLKGILRDMYDIFMFDPNITLLETGKNSGVINYLGMNNKLINITFRKAISYSLNYSYIIDDLLMGQAVRLKSPIPLGIKYANWSLNVPIFNLTHARLVMQSMGFGIGFDLYSDAEWLNQESTSPFAIFNYTYNIGNTLREDILILLQDNLAKIGIRVTDAGMTFGDFLNRLYEIPPYHRNNLQLYWYGWDPDYNDPMNFINPLFTNRSIASNGVQYNGWEEAINQGRNPKDLWDNVQLLMEAQVYETDPVQREKMFHRIQQLLVEQDYPWCWGIADKLIYAYHINLTGVMQNVLGWLYFYPCKWMPYDYGMTISHPLDITYEESDTGNSIAWGIISERVDNPIYYIYRDNSVIDTDNWEIGVPILINVDGLPAGTHEYRLEAHNAHKVADDIVFVTVTKGEPEIPGFSLLFLIGTAVFTLLYVSEKLRKKII
ncbi:MAG: ABC transporter substrate-binding protein [Promethearchaeota archaeon]